MQSKSDPFAERLSQCVGGPWYLNTALNEPDDQVIQLTHIDPGQPWSDPSSFLDFLDINYHRRLVRCLIGRTPWEKKASWPLEKLMQETRPTSLEALEEALAFCHVQEFAFSNVTRQVEERLRAWYRTIPEINALPFSEEEEAKHLALFSEKRHTWYGDDRLIALPTFGPSLEWTIQAALQREYRVLARRHVSLGKLGQLGDIDVLAFLEDGRTMMVECKSSSKRITNEHVERFVKRARVFTPADIALLLIDSDDFNQMQQRRSQLCMVMLMEYGEYHINRFLTLGGSHIYHLRDNLYVSDTGGGIFNTLKFVLLHQKSFSSR
jgi:hypothetical protein